MNSLTRISRRKLYQELILRLQSTAATSSSASSSDIYIPNRIERGPTDILKVLESTISRDYTAPHYKYHDDPYLIPLSTMHNRTYAFAHESGKKAAMWIKKEHADLFQHKLADPEIKAFIPSPVYTENSKVTEETLLNEISNGNVPDSITIYELLKGEVTIPTKQALLELLCFHNNSEPINTELLENNWFQYKQQRFNNIWISRPQIDILFEFLKKQEPIVAAAAYNALICGLAKYYNIDKAWYLYIECQENNIPLSIDGYNAILSLVPLLKQGGTKPRTMIMDIYRAMAANGIIPNIHTFNAALSTAVTLTSNQIAIQFTSEILADIKKFKLKPSLTTYYYVLHILSNFGDAAYENFMNILESLKKETLTIQDKRDTDFFVTAMKIASKQFCDRRAGEIVNELLLTGDNYKFIGDNYKESIYYREYLNLILATEELETFFTIYNKLVPHVTIPEPALMQTILEALQLHPAQTITQYIPKLWSHMVMFGHTDREDLLANILHLMNVHCKSAPESPLNAQFTEIALAIWNHIQDKKKIKRQHIMISNTNIANIIILLLRGDNFEQALEVMSSLIQSPHLIIGAITTEHINEIFELTLAEAYVPAILILLEYLISSGLEGAEEMARKLYKNIPLTSTQENILIKLVGNNVLESQVSND